MALAQREITQRLVWLARTPGCGDLCSDRFGHHAETHEAYGAVQARIGKGPALIVTGPLAINIEQATVAVAGRMVAVSGRPWQLLELLASHLGQLVRYETIIRTVWGPEWLSTRETSQHSVSITAGRLRGVLGVGGPLIVTRVGIGLQLFEVPAGDASSADLLAAISIDPSKSRRRQALTRVSKGGYWSRLYDRCERCQRNDRPHDARGLCAACHSAWRRAKKLGRPWP